MYRRLLLIAGVSSDAFIRVEPFSRALFIVSVLMLATVGILDVLDLLAE